MLRRLCLAPFFRESPLSGGRHPGQGASPDVGQRQLPADCAAALHPERGQRREACRPGPPAPTNIYIQARVAARSAMPFDRQYAADPIGNDAPRPLPAPLQATTASDPVRPVHSLARFAHHMPLPAHRTGWMTDFSCRSEGRGRCRTFMGSLCCGMPALYEVTRSTDEPVISKFIHISLENI